ncbi:phosphoribosyl-AMP cyclohydrolase [Candidatus Poribacteria bacterium]
MNRKDAESKIDMAQIEEGAEILLDFDKLQKIAQGGEPVVPVAVQDVESKEILVVAYVNEAALEYTLEHGIAAFWSTSRNELWVKGMTSGDKLQLVDILVNCEQNSLVYLVKLLGNGSCHTKDADGELRFTCYYRRIKDGKLELIP